ncbi:DNA mobilization endonuclease VirD1/MobC family subunit [Notoacmeibacter sp. MSK16QG-6]|uniref:DNA mobilization endonuclease VirD1/MobC family subunit n=1 Tax=Notoacmeibacter sp. MSK16QG-6 TaxID=2957982 RepID=UPI0020A1159F|nr:DNA mobilization endonuclease VirD1/MobC family subunit [Notoacmeibacter sp. MSK16QG-6]MCP1200617.1 DNA mobilization endonuclease VirD1/MobC family subunit [Notoacmeibacter sp. MSK16QG-6]
MTANGHDVSTDLLFSTSTTAGKPAPKAARPGADPNAYKVVSVRLRAAEYECLSLQAKALGLSNNMAMRVAARRIGGFLETDEQTRQLLQDITDQIGDIARALNEIDSASAKNGKTDLGRLATLRAAFGHEFVQLDALLRSILNLSRRRVDGRLMLQKAMLG